MNFFKLSIILVALISLISTLGFLLLEPKLNYLIIAATSIIIFEIRMLENLIIQGNYIDKTK